MGVNLQPCLDTVIEIPFTFLKKNNFNIEIIEWKGIQEKENFKKFRNLMENNFVFEMERDAIRNYCGEEENCILRLM